jgi:hypothetical protein
MEFISVADNAHGFIAIGQHAKGFIAIGQVATGVIAIGQMAKGCFTVGQLAFGFIGWGQVGFGLLHAVGMVGAGGRGFGLVLPLVPGVGRARVPPETIALDAAMRGEAGWVVVDIFFDGHGLGLGHEGTRLPIKLDRRLQGDADLLTVHGPSRVWAFVRTIDTTRVCERIVHVPPRPFEKPGFYVWGAIQFALLCVMAIAWWLVVGEEVLGVLVSL